MWKRQGDIFTLNDSVEVHAPIERCFALTCSVALVHEELGMIAKDGRTEGLVVGGDVVRWEGWQLRMKHFHVSHISSYDKPVFMQDTMLDGRFKTFQHDHHLQQRSDGIILLQDEVRFSLPFALAGRLVGRMVMVPHIRRLLRNRFARIKRLAEGDGWMEYLPEENGITTVG
jgi:hypothetical protein